MTDLTFCYIHMTRNELLTLDTVDTPEYIKGDLEDDELEIPSYMIPPNPDDSDSVQVYLPSQVHPSYPYGNPTSVKHPVNKPRAGFDPTSRALFEDMGFAGGGVNGQFRWHELALDQLLPVDEEKEELKRAAQARKMASGATSNHGQQQQQAAAQHMETPFEADDEEEEEDDGDDEDEDDDEDDEDSEDDI
ncbi:hypothetical protein FA15DRAFT_203701 [Coprinopsis marcescibilis]|uniref:Uncharacterized protein n=1 Tax=Coprinopsis marcescibilis TaxID=230819 RepID=A0A5C3LBS6_COPMA|nr:hypothetical protein FA15DRAFT_203701 [Coprinopsis marcescibilis]